MSIVGAVTLKQRYMILTRSCYSNNQFETESRLVDDLTLHPCHTIDPEEADAFIVPVQVRLFCSKDEEAATC